MKIPSSVQNIIQGILNNEGGFQNDPDDTGNYANGVLVGTNLGITPTALAAYRGVDVGSITEEDIRNLTEEEAIDIYAQDYYYGPGFDKIDNDYLRENVVDMAVNAGPSRATKLLQRLAGVTEDGVLGPMTTQAVNDAGISTNDYSTQRKRFYLDLVLNDPIKVKYLPGWAFRADKYKTSDGEGVIPLSAQVEVDDDIKKPLAVLPEDMVAQVPAKAVADQIGTFDNELLGFNEEFFIDPMIVPEYKPRNV